MNRRSLLRLSATGTATISLSGCLSCADLTRWANRPDDTTIALEEIDSPSPAENCGPAALPLSALLGEGRRKSDQRTDRCYRDATTSLAIENERDEATTVTVDIDNYAGDDVFERTYDLTPGERVTEGSVIPAHDDHAVTVTVDDSVPETGSWERSSCFRHGIAIRPDGVAIGYIEPFEGPGDTQYDCYAGDSSFIHIYNGESRQTVRIRIHDLCADETFEKTLEMDPEERTGIDELLTVAGVFDITVDVDDGETKSGGFREICRGLQAIIEEDGTVELRYWTG